ncbi:hypothetical protein SAY87_017787 [Trapa incisa]|uniref:DNA mismatch repair protein MLH3 n=1 Tax=Trapa incisa TaxID=236973 RepID=A0AAN7L301_9MYRT|nr:hypothetical protein SAY87_017787 [Trapa incisa]
MDTIKPLPQSVHSAVRSGIFLFDLTRVVEELIFNSLDAAATKVSVFIGVGTFSLKVVDNGSGITRDDLVLLGERYATSKCWPSKDTGTVIGSFGSHGEALSSISDISLIEIITKTHGSPNGYRKLLKGCKCLHLGIDDDVKAVGTTVIVHDLFYNQPIRRKYIQSSPRKVLDSIKKHVLRTALVHTEVSFEVTDIESGNELIATKPSLSPLSLLRNNFGFDVPNALRELNACEGVLNLTGHMSGPWDDFSFKAFQYVYINSQFICKSPIHKLVNQLAAKFDFSTSWKDHFGFQNGKRSRPHACPAYLLRLNCPRVMYDLTFEHSKTYVEFKDWNRILKFVEDVVLHFWKENITEGKYSHISADVSGKSPERGVLGREGRIFPRKFESPEKRFRFKGDSSTSFFLFDSSTEEANSLSHMDKLGIPLQECDTSPEKFRGQQNEMDYFRCIDYFSWGDSGSLVKCTSSRILMDEDYKCRSDDIFCFDDTSFGCTKRDVLEEEQIGDSYLRDNCSSSIRKEEFCGVDFITSEKLGVDMSYDSPEGFPLGRDRRNLFPKSCSAQEKPSFDGVNFGGFRTDNFRRKQSKFKRSDDDMYSPQVFPMRLFYNSHLTDVDISSYSRPCMDSFLWPYDFMQMESVSSSAHSLNSSWLSPFSDPLLHDMTWDGIVLESSLSRKCARKRHLPDKICLKLRGEEEARVHSRYRAFEQSNGKVERSRRSYSAPPFHRKKRRFNSLSHLQMVDGKKSDADTNLDAFAVLEASKLEHSSAYSKEQSAAVLLESRQVTGNCSEVDPGVATTNQDIIHMAIKDSRDYGSKWRDSCLQRNESRGTREENNILDISSGFLFLAGSSLVPESITKNCLFDAKVLQQVDKKFIPVVAGGTLAVIDQHAADERIRLEVLRQKVISGEAKTITYLDSEKDLLLPEIGYQLLHDYSEQIKGWGWICNIHSQCSGPFKQDLNIINKQRTAITLLAVPCILGIDLTDADLLEFIQQLVDTDGASTMPPAVLRILNLKACRGAIMFGDSLLPSECSLIVEELRQTSLCFQCAHGRPTTVPLVSLEALHKQIPKLCGVNGLSDEPWHGLCRNKLSLERTAQRLRSASGQN